MKKLLLASAIVLFASNAMAGNLYVSPKFGYSFEKSDKMWGPWVSGSDNDNVFHVGFAVGYDLSKIWGVNLRTEGEYMYHAKADAKVDYAKMETTIHSLNANLYYDFKNDTPFTPYVGAGLGFSFVDTKFSNPIMSFSDDKIKFTYNLQAGLDFSIDEHNTVGIGYRYSDLGGSRAANEDGSLEAKARHPSHDLTLTYRFTF